MSSSIFFIKVLMQTIQAIHRSIVDKTRAWNATKCYKKDQEDNLVDAYVSLQKFQKLQKLCPGTYFDEKIRIAQDRLALIMEQIEKCDKIMTELRNQLRISYERIHQLEQQIYVELMQV